MKKFFRRSVSLGGAERELRRNGKRRVRGKNNCEDEARREEKIVSR